MTGSSRPKNRAIASCARAVAPSGLNARTYLPIRMVTGAAGDVTAVRDFRYLPPTSANLALLRVPIPAGYPRSVPER